MLIALLPSEMVLAGSFYLLSVIRVPKILKFCGQILALFFTITFSHINCQPEVILMESLRIRFYGNVRIQTTTKNVMFSEALFIRASLMHTIHLHIQT